MDDFSSKFYPPMTANGNKKLKKINTSNNSAETTVRYLIKHLQF